MEIIRNLTRRKLRNILTISGIVIGVLALVTMGAMAEKFNALKLQIAQGRNLTTGSTGEVVLGSDFATEFKKSVGNTIDLPIRAKDAPPDFVNHSFTVVGILAKTQTAPDTGAYVSLTDAQMLLKETLPASIRNSIDTTKLVNGATVYGKRGADLDKLADKINAEVPGVKATKPSVLVASFNAGGAIFTAITTGAALIALIVGGLSVINTMLMAVTERVREIGLKKAVGAKVGHILRECLLEAVLIGSIGGGIGLLLGWGLTSLINAATASSNLTLFLLSWRLVIVAILFSVGLGAVAGIIPALRASRMDPVRALRAA